MLCQNGLNFLTGQLTSIASVTSESIGQINLLDLTGILFVSIIAVIGAVVFVLIEVPPAVTVVIAVFVPRVVEVVF